MIDLAPLGLAVGHAADEHGATGCTVVRGIDGPLRGGVAVLGRATGTRETAALDPAHVTGRVDAILLTGGSAYGLDAASGVMRWHEEHGRGFDVGGGVVPIVPAAVIFDLAPLGRFDARPTPAMAYDACARAVPSGFAEGSVGVGAGATVGKVLGPARAMKGGFGCAVERAGALVVAGMAVVNAVGDVRDADGRILAGARASEGGFADATRVLAGLPAEAAAPAFGRGAHHTTLAIVATNALLDGTQRAGLARAATAALFRRITPTGTVFDGDVVFALSPFEGELVRPPVQIEALAVRALERAIERAVRLARGRDGIPGLADDAGDPRGAGAADAARGR